MFFLCELPLNDKKMSNQPCNFTNWNLQHPYPRTKKGHLFWTDYSSPVPTSHEFPFSLQSSWTLSCNTHSIQLQFTFFLSYRWMHSHSHTLTKRAGMNAAANTCADWLEWVVVPYQSMARSSECVLAQFRIVSEWN